MNDIKLEELKEINKSLLKKIISQIEEEDLEELTVEVDDKKYGFGVIEDSGWEDDGRGKYYFKNTTYVLVLYSDSWNVIEKYNVIAEQSISRTGSYYTDWNYEYDKPTFKYAYEQLIPEQIIPAHTVIGLKDIEM